MKVEDLKKIVSECRWYPSGDNCQPFRYQWDSDTQTLSIFHKEEESKHIFNTENTASAIAFGGSLTLLKLAALKRGYETQIELEEEDPLWAKVNFNQASNHQSSSLDFFKRYTHRGVYYKGSNEEILQTLQQWSSQCKTKGVFYPSEKTLSKQVAKTESHMGNWKRALQDLLKMVYFDDPKTILKGMHWKNLGVTIFDSWMLRALKKFKFLFPLMLPSIRINYYVLTQFKLNRGNGILSFHFNDFKRATLVEFGQEVILFWLKIANKGYFMQPLSMSSLLLTQIKAQKYTGPTDSSSYQFLQKAEPIFVLPNQKEGSGCWAFRVGKAKELNEESKTQRLPVEEVLEIL